MSKGKHYQRGMIQYKNSFKTITGNYITAKNMISCPYCGKKMIYRNAEGIKINKYKDEWLLVCEDPGCDCYCRVKKMSNGRTQLISTPARAKLRALRNEAHYYLEKIIEFGIFERKEAYRWLTGIVAPETFGVKHIGEFSEYYCERAIAACIRVLYNNRNTKNICFRHFCNKETNDATYNNSELKKYLMSLEMGVA